MDDESDEEIDDSINDTTEEVDNTEAVEEVADADVEETEDKPEYTEHEKKQFARAKKAEAELKEAKEKIAKLEAKPEKVDDAQLTPKDTLAFINAKITVEEDIDEVLDYAKHKNISVTEALKTTVVKTILAEKAEQRNTAEATNTGSVRRGTSKATPSQIMDKASKGQLPDDPDELAEAWIQSKKAK